LTTLDCYNRLHVYDLNLRKKRTIDLQFDTEFFRGYENGYLLYSKPGLFYINKSGRLIDFQPVNINVNNVDDTFIFLTDKGILHLDSLTLRPITFKKNDKNIVRLIPINNSGYALAIDTHHSFYSVNINTMDMEPSMIKIKKFEKILPKPPAVSSDSLWYFQLGAFVQYNNAIDMLSTFRQNNLPAFIDTTELYRIKLGGFRDKTIALNIIEKSDLDGWFIFQESIKQQGRIEFFVGTDKYILEDGVIKKE
jgi:hypothetical protein